MIVPKPHGFAMPPDPDSFMRQNAFNIVFFLFLAGGIVALWWYADQNWFPKQDPPAAARKEDEKKDKDAKKEEKDKPAPKVEPPAPVKYEPPTLIALGGEGFFISTLVTTQGGGVQQVVLPRFQEADRIGRGEPNTPLYVIPGIAQPRTKYLADNPPTPALQPGLAPDPADPKTPANQRISEPSYTLLNYPLNDENFPDPALGYANWQVVEKQLQGDEHRVVFETTLPAPILMKIRKTYTLRKTDYHIGLKVQFERLPGGKRGAGATRFQITGPRQLPVEGEWYTSLTRVSLIGWENKSGAFKRQYDDAPSIGMMRGGDKALGVGGENSFKYAAIATQYFASALAIDDPDGKTRWAWVRSTTELPIIPSPDEIKKLEDEVKQKPENPFLAARLAGINEVRNRKLPELDDITFRAVTDPIDLDAGESLTHSYAIYNGPTKVHLLGMLQGDQKVADQLVQHYENDLKLDTLTDYRSPTALGRFAEAIGWSYLVITFTNVMHWLLWAIHAVIGNWGLSIIILTIMVRLLLFIPSRKQTQMNLRMMEIQKKLKPELDKLHEKYKDDFQTYNREKTRLMMQHGMNPFAAMGGCLLLFAQMPIMMGLYYCLQESIFFRLEPFLWIDNLAAPDMTVWWGEHVPLISDPDNRHGTFSFLYLGPYLNILPLIAVSLMLYQQNKMMPPPTDEQQAAQQRMMKIMMIVVAFMFYKVAAGLALYFIISTSWGVIERQFIPKPKLKPGDETGTPAGPGPEYSPSGGAEKPKGFVGRFRQRLQERIEELQKQAEAQASRQAKNPYKQDPIRRDKKKKKK
jgi:YidC/Oxa1 family membrane protein insertase